MWHSSKFIIQKQHPIIEYLILVPSGDSIQTSRPNLVDRKFETEPYDKHLDYSDTTLHEDFDRLGQNLHTSKFLTSID